MVILVNMTDISYHHLPNTLSKQGLERRDMVTRTDLPTFNTQKLELEWTPDMGSAITIHSFVDLVIVSILAALSLHLGNCFHSSSLISTSRQLSILAALSLHLGNCFHSSSPISTFRSAFLTVLPHSPPIKMRDYPFYQLYLCIQAYPPAPPIKM